jgi:serine/threonine-protein phosphatase 6 regulatory ankyrin repeat subunit B
MKSMATKYPLHEAIHVGYFEKVIELISLGHDINEINDFGQTVLHVGIDNRQTDIIRFLLYIQNDKNLLNKSLNTHDISKSLNTHDISKSLNTHDIYRNTPLVLAVDRNNREITEILLKMGSNVNVNMNDTINDNKWQTKYPLMIAVLYGYYDIFEMLMSYGANPFITDKEGYTLLHYASENGYIKIVYRLINCGLDVNATNNLGQTSLQLACKSNYIDVVNLLLSYRAFIVNDINNKSPIYYAIKNENYDIVTLLMDNLDVNINDESIQNIRKSPRMELFLRYKSRLPYLKLGMSCYSLKNECHISKYLFDILVAMDICTYL